MTIDRDAGGVCFTSHRRGADAPAPAGFRARYRPVGEAFQAAAGSLDHWLTERYCLYTFVDERRVLRGDIHHPPWPLQHAEADIDINTMTAEIGVDLAGEPLLHYARRQDVVFWTLRECGRSPDGSEPPT